MSLPPLCARRGRRTTKNQNNRESGQAVRAALSVDGIVEDVRVEGSQRMLKVGGQWYRGEKPGVEIFEGAEGLRIAPHHLRLHCERKGVYGSSSGIKVRRDRVVTA